MSESEQAGESENTPANKEEMLAKIKEQCPFCLIGSGKIPAVKIHEDDICMAVLDINPLKRGHTILFPKEHYPIFALVPPKIVEHLAKIQKFIAAAQKKTVAVDSTVTFIANGGIAGQQAAHCLMHIIPKDPGFNHFEPKPSEIPADKIVEFVSKVSPYIMQKLFPVNDGQKKAMSQYLESNPDMYKLLVTNPAGFSALMSQNADVAKVFAGVDVASLSARLSAVNK
jgi:diadenosine tetraphosphate (Ap4A) HIT family hydrolase